MARTRKDSKLDAVSKVPLFRGFSGKELSRVASAADRVEYEKGATLGSQGEPGTQAFVVMSGSVIVRRNGRKVATLGPGEVAGELSILDRGPRTADLVAAEPTEVLVIEQRAFKGLVDSTPALQRKLLATLSSRLREADARHFG